MFVIGKHTPKHLYIIKGNNRDVAFYWRSQLRFSTKKKKYELTLTRVRTIH